MNDLVKNLRIVAGMIEMGELIKFGSDSELMLEAAKQVEADTALLEKIRDDLLTRSDERDVDGTVVVNVGASTWDKLCERIDL